VSSSDLDEFLPVLDNLDRAISLGTPAEAEGMRLIRSQLMRVLEGYGLERFGAVGERFDPRVHEAMDVAEVEDPAHHGTVVAEWQPGYRVGERVVRPARVQVGRY
jgi:molecular chaperone GrpE (heat shock protein)